MDIQTAQSFLDDNFASWVRALQPRVDAVTETGVTLSIPITEELARVGGIISGQALATLADTAMVLATGASMGAFKPVATTNLDVQFLRPGVGERIDCHAEIVRIGKSLAFTRATLLAQPAGKAVATATATFFIP